MANYLKAWLNVCMLPTFNLCTQVEFMLYIIGLTGGCGSLAVATPSANHKLHV